MSTSIKSIRNIFLTGLLAMLPLYLTVKALVAVFHFVDTGAGTWLELLGLQRFPGAGILTTLLLIFVVGALVTQIGVSRFGAALESVVQRIPGVGRLYGTIRTLLDPLTHPESRPFRDAVWVEVGEGMRVMGFVTSAPFEEIPGEPARVNVYLPMSHPYVGYVVTVTPDRLRPCPAVFEEVISYHFSCGSAQIRAYRDAGEATSKLRSGESKVPAAPA